MVATVVEHGRASLDTCRHRKLRLSDWRSAGPAVKLMFATDCGSAAGAFIAIGLLATDVSELIF
jgi:hypothetical protein